MVNLMTTLHTRVARHGRSTVLIVPPAEARKAGLRPGQTIDVEPVEKQEQPWAGSLTRLGVTRRQMELAERGMWE